jgi:iron complex transport system permease protein
MNKRKLTALILIVSPIIAFYFSLFFGRYQISPSLIFQILLSDITPFKQPLPYLDVTIVNMIRLPRVLLAMTIGAGMAINGASFQGVFQNPLVSADILGVSAAASFGGALVIFIGGDIALLQLSAFSFGILAIVLAYTMSRIYKTTPLLLLVLSGVVVSSLFSAMLSILISLAPPDTKLQPIIFWLMGSLAATTWDTIFPAVPLIIAGIIGLLLVRWRINILAMGDKEARALGLKTERLKVFIIICSTIITAAAVTVSGIIGWVGIMIPHVTRMIVGPDHKVLLPASIAVGATYLLVMDDIARTLTAGEIPLGVLTAVVGAPFFMFILRKTKGGWK